MSKKLLVFLTLIVAVATVGATIYKWVDDQGVTHYSATPPPKQKAKEIPIQTSAAASSDGGQPAAKGWQEKEREFQKRRVEREAAEKKQKEQEAKAKQEAIARKQRCILARQNLHVLQMQKPVYSINEKGEREYLDDKMRAAEIERLKKEIEVYCKPQ